ncbi:MAG: hypothetical protein A2001_02230 [Treponema sp. GWC1_61_84]|nr:MAG: hypothetical protein A2001_02230 [Treponema sp. GWC1_61_84]
MKPEVFPRPRSGRFVLLIALGATLSLGAIIGGILLIIGRSTPLAALVDVDPGTVRLIAELIEERSRSGGSAFEMAEFADWAELEARGAPKPDLVLGADGVALRTGAYRELADAPERSIPSSLRKTGFDGKRRYAFPLQFDHFEIVYQRRRFAAAGLVVPRDLAELENAAAALSGPNFAPILVAGGETDDMLQFVGAMIEAMGGIEAYRAATAALAVSGDPGSVLDRELVRGLRLRDVLEKLLDWRKRGLLNASWFRLTANDFASLIESDRCAVACLELSYHRTLPTAVMERFAVGYFPAADAGARRALQSVALVGAVPAKAAHADAARALLYALAAPEAQTRLAEASGLAPAAAAAGASDSQATDTRFWLASLQGAMVDLGRAVRDTRAGRDELAAAFRAYFTVDGVGY